MRDNGPDIRAVLYEAATSQWMHAEQIRWNILYYFFVAHSILVVAWATLLGGTCGRPYVWVVLRVLPATGMVLGALQMLLADRATRFTEAYFQRALELEPGHNAGGFAAARDLRKRLQLPGERGGLLTTSQVTYSMAAVMVIIHAVLLAVGIRN